MYQIVRCLILVSKSANKTKARDISSSGPVPFLTCSTSSTENIKSPVEEPCPSVSRITFPMSASRPRPTQQHLEMQELSSIRPSKPCIGPQEEVELVAMYCQYLNDPTSAKVKISRIVLQAPIAQANWKYDLPSDERLPPYDVLERQNLPRYDNDTATNSEHAAIAKSPLQASEALQIASAISIISNTNDPTFSMSSNAFTDIVAPTQPSSPPSNSPRSLVSTQKAAGEVHTTSCEPQQHERYHAEFVQDNEPYPDSPIYTQHEYENRYQHEAYKKCHEEMFGVMYGKRRYVEQYAVTVAGVDPKDKIKTAIE